MGVEKGGRDASGASCFDRNPGGGNWGSAALPGDGNNLKNRFKKKSKISRDG
jgi:hypothetical protein